MKFNEKLIFLMKRNKINSKKLAAAVGLSPSAISQYLHCRREPSFDLLMKIARALGCNGADLLSDSDQEIFVHVAFTLEGKSYIYRSTLNCSVGDYVVVPVCHNNCVTLSLAFVKQVSPANCNISPEHYSAILAVVPKIEVPNDNRI